MSDAPETPSAPAKAPDVHPLDALTGGAFSAATSGERAARIREWLATQPAPDQLQEVFKELSGRDKGAARAVRERLDERADDLASSLGAQAANACGEGEDVQDEAISSAESWVSDNVGNAGLGECIAAVLWLDGPQAGAALLRQAMSKG